MLVSRFPSLIFSMFVATTVILVGAMDLNGGKKFNTVVALNTNAFLKTIL